MIILRKKIKSFTDPISESDKSSQETASKLSRENMDLQKQMMNNRNQIQIMKNQAQRQKIQAQKDRDRTKLLNSAIKAEEIKDEQTRKDQIDLKKIEKNNTTSEAKNVRLFKNPSKPIPPVSMKT